MVKLERFLVGEGYAVSNIGYPSRKFAVPELSRIVRSKIAKLTVEGEQVHFVTHSMGGILLRHLQETNPIQGLKRVVMLSPPNSGSEVVDRLGSWRVFKAINGAAGSQLGRKEGSFVRTLGPVDFEVGVLTGSRTVNPILSLMIPGRDDGKVSINSAKVAGMKDFKVMKASHPFIMRKRSVHLQVLSFLKQGHFISGDR